MPDLDLDRHVAELETNGYTVVPDVMSDSERGAMRQAMHETLDAEKEIARRFRSQTEDLLHCFNVQSKHPFFYGFPFRSPKPIQVARKVLGEDMFIHNAVIRIPMPTGSKETMRMGGQLHVDWHDFTVLPFVGGKHYPLAVQSAWCVSEFTKENGGTLVWPGLTYRSKRRSRIRAPCRRDIYRWKRRPGPSSCGTRLSGTQPA